MERSFTDVSKGPHCASLYHSGFGFLAFVLWAFNAPFPGTLTSTFPPALLRALSQQTTHFPGCYSTLFLGCYGGGGRAESCKRWFLGLGEQGSPSSHGVCGRWGRPGGLTGCPAHSRSPACLGRQSIQGRGTEAPGGLHPGGAPAPA